MADVMVGMRLKSLVPDTIFSPITVTELTEHGFKYSLDEEKALIPRLGMKLCRDGHEHYGFNGEALYEPDAAQVDANRVLLTGLQAGAGIDEPEFRENEGNKYGIVQ